MVMVMEEWMLLNSWLNLLCPCCLLVATLLNRQLLMVGHTHIHTTHTLHMFFILSFSSPAGLVESTMERTGSLLTKLRQHSVDQHRQVKKVCHSKCFLCHLTVSDVAHLCSLLHT